MPPRNKEKQDLVEKVLEDFSKDNKAHEPFITAADARYRSYEAILERRSEAASWTNKQHPAIVLPSVETIAAAILNTQPVPNLQPYPIMGSEEEIERARKGARANELLLKQQMCTDKFAEKQRTFDLQALITGITASKQYWKKTRGKVRYREAYEAPSKDLYGAVSGYETRTRPATSDEQVIHNDPTMEVIDVRHLIFQNGASSLASCERITHRAFLTFDRVKELVAAGFYGPKAGGEDLPSYDDLKGSARKHFQRENELWQTEPHQDDIVILEQWREGGRRVVTIANDSLLLADKPNPFWFDYLDHPYPFVICSPMPGLFRIPGKSEVELMAELQEMIWTLMNQRLDVTQLVANAIFMIADDVEDPESFEFAPGERWLVPRPVEETIKPWTPDIDVAQVSMEAERLLRGDVQNATGGAPFLSGGESDGVDQETATGVSIITSLAQRRVAAKQQQFVWAKTRILEQWCALNQQYLEPSRLIPVIGSDGAMAWEEIRSEIIQGRYLFESEVVNESLQRQEKRAEKQAFLQVFLSAVPVFAAIGAPLNPKAAMDEFLEAYDIEDKDKFYSSMPQPAAMAGQPGQAAPEANGAGVTNPLLAAGPTSPSNEISMSPAAALQRAGAATGGSANAPSPFG